MEVVSAFSGTGAVLRVLVSFTEYDDVTHPESPLRYLFSRYTHLGGGGIFMDIGILLSVSISIDFFYTGLL